jgi:hypothetical protein
MNRRLLTVAVAAASLASAQAGHAQRALEVSLVPRAGVVTPAGWFYVEFKQFGVQPMVWTEAAILRAPLAALAAELRLAQGIWIRGEAARTVGAELLVIDAVLLPVSGFDPPRVDRTRYHLPAAVTTGSLDLAFPTRLRLPGGIQPYVTGGVGAKRYAMDVTPLEGREERIVFPQPGTVAMFNVGGGAAFQLRGVGVDLLVRDAVSEYWGEMQHDVMFLAGLSFRVF